MGSVTLTLFGGRRVTQRGFTHRSSTLSSGNLREEAPPESKTIAAGVFRRTMSLSFVAAVGTLCEECARQTLCNCIWQKGKES
ncbi:hypothetical protein CEXT_579021 [Caerostris extrusa]|uniref:Uncharacterized protein n=1 Tax=Caerostris extrusa TaxID=172846 RepID=A0AAV4NNV2_CAEEX|nr:hypothetical protein CEXT_579021 [Caerostris extrusa]